MLSAADHAKTVNLVSPSDSDGDSDDPRSWNYVVKTPMELANEWDKVVYLKPKEKTYGTSVGIRFKAPNMKGKEVNKTISLSATHPYFMPFDVRAQENQETGEISHYQATFSFDYNRGKDKTGDHHERLTDEDCQGLLIIQENLVRDIAVHRNEWNAGISDESELRGKDEMFSKSKFSPIIRWAGKKNKKTGMYDFTDEWGPNMNVKIGFTARTEQDPATGEDLEVHVLQCEYYNQEGEPYEELTNLMLPAELPKLNRAVPLIDMSSVWLGEKAISIRMYISQIQSFKFQKRAKGKLRVRAVQVETVEDMADVTAEEADADADVDTGTSAGAGADVVPAPAPKPRARPSFGIRSRPKINLT